MKRRQGKFTGRNLGSRQMDHLLLTLQQLGSTSLAEVESVDCISEQLHPPIAGSLPSVKGKIDVLRLVSTDLVARWNLKVPPSVEKLCGK